MFISMGAPRVAELDHEFSSPQKFRDNDVSLVIFQNKLKNEISWPGTNKLSRMCPFGKTTLVGNERFKQVEKKPKHFKLFKLFREIVE